MSKIKGTVIKDSEIVGYHDEDHLPICRSCAENNHDEEEIAEFGPITKEDVKDFPDVCDKCREKIKAS